MATYESKKYASIPIAATQVADGSVTNAEFQFINTVSSNVQTQVDAKAATAGATFTGAVRINDSQNLLIGSGTDLVISHDTNNSKINNTTGELRIAGDTIKLMNQAEDETHVTATADGAVGLRHNNVEKLATSATGVTVSGTVAATAVTGDGSGLTGLPSAAISTYNDSGDNRVITSVNSNTVQGEEDLTFDGTALTTTRITSSIGIHITGSTERLGLAIGDAGEANTMFFVRPSEDNNKILALMRTVDDSSATGNRICFGVSGSGQTIVGGGHLGGVLNVSGSDIEKLISVKSDTKDPVFYLSGSGEIYNSGSLTLKDHMPYLYLSRSVSVANALIGMNDSENILIQNNTENRHIVFKCNDGGTIKEGLRLDGNIPEVVVNQGGTDFNNTLVNFRVESDNN